MTTYHALSYYSGKRRTSCRTPDRNIGSSPTILLHCLRQAISKCRPIRRAHQFVRSSPQDSFPRHAKYPACQAEYPGGAGQAQRKGTEARRERATQDRSRSRREGDQVDVERTEPRPSTDIIRRYQVHRFQERGMGEHPFNVRRLVVYPCNWPGCCQSLGGLVSLPFTSTGSGHLFQRLFHDACYIAPLRPSRPTPTSPTGTCVSYRRLVFDGWHDANPPTATATATASTSVPRCASSDGRDKRTSASRPRAASCTTHVIHTRVGCSRFRDCNCGTRSSGPQSFQV
jgi:hypothetical protein